MFLVSMLAKAIKRFIHLGPIQVYICSLHFKRFSVKPMGHHTRYGTMWHLMHSFTFILSVFLRVKGQTKMWQIIMAYSRLQHLIIIYIFYLPCRFEATIVMDFA